VTNGDKSESTRKESVRAGWASNRNPGDRQYQLHQFALYRPLRELQRNARPRPTVAEQLTTFTIDMVRTGEAVKRYHLSFEGRLDGAGGLHGLALSAAPRASSNRAAGG
jgi:hypothetical protein